jgi:hypothetical protein
LPGGQITPQAPSAAVSNSNREVLFHNPFFCDVRISIVRYSAEPEDLLIANYPMRLKSLLQKLHLFSDKGDSAERAIKEKQRAQRKKEKIMVPNS